MDVYLLFRKKSPLTEEGLPWLCGAYKHEFAARRNASGHGVVSAVLVRSLMACLDGAVQEAVANPGGDIAARVRSASAPSSSAVCAWKGGAFYIPHGEPGKITYHAGTLAILGGLQRPAQAADFWEAYQVLQADYLLYGKAVGIRESLCRACDELYYFMRYADLDPQPENDRLSKTEIAANLRIDIPPGAAPLDLAPLTDPAALQRLRGQPPAAAKPAPAPLETADLDGAKDGFVGWQMAALAEALAAGEHVLLAGPTGSGKTVCFQQVANGLSAAVVAIEGKEGLTDLDFLGAILPQADNSRRWVDGPLLRALRQAASEPVLLFLDEINRIPRRHVNLLLTLLNPKPGEFCRRMGIAAVEDEPYYVIEVPMTSEVAACPVRNLRLVAAGNFGRAYAVYDLDPALRRRFDTVLEFDYLETAQELALVQRRAGVGGKVALALTQVAQETRRLMGNGELPGCIDTASLLNWAAKCQRMGVRSVEGVMQAAGLVWADTVCGRDHQGRVNSGNFKAIQDYLVSLALLPGGGAV